MHAYVSPVVTAIPNASLRCYTLIPLTSNCIESTPPKKGGERKKHARSLIYQITTKSWILLGSALDTELLRSALFFPTPLYASPKTPTLPLPTLLAMSQ